MLDAALALDDDVASLRLSLQPRAHLVGIAGTGMRSLAEVLFGGGWQITGSDPRAPRVGNLPYDICDSHNAGTIDNSVDLVVYSDAVPPHNPELQRARQLGVKVLSYPQALGQLMAPRGGIAVAGTHGKSTTTAMAAEMLIAAGFDPTVVIGAEPIGANSGGRFGAGRWMLAEACEYRANFCHMKPDVAAVLNIEPDHFDCFASQEELEAAFARFVGQVPGEGLIVSRVDCPATRRVLAHASAVRETFGLSPAATWYAADVRQRRGYYSFQIRSRERLVCEVKLPVPGRHNMLNAVAAAALASHVGASATAIRTGLERFAGLKRRLQLLGEVRDVALVDDYAHHPTEVAAALTTLRQMYPDRRLWCVFEPHQASRLARLLDGFADSLHNADKVVLAEVCRAREESPPEVTSADLHARLAAKGCDAVHLASQTNILEYLKPALRAGDVVVAMGAGEIGRVAHELGKGLRTFRKAG